MAKKDVWCDACRQPITSGCPLREIVRDSSAIYVYDLGFDGWRQVTACSPEHLAALCEWFGQRPFVEEELCVNKIARVLDERPGLKFESLPEAAGLAASQVERAIAWQNERFDRWWDQQCR